MASAKFPSLDAIRKFFNMKTGRKVPLTQNQRLPAEQQAVIIKAAEDKRERRRQKRLGNR